jgi:hypothetical protein
MNRAKILFQNFSTVADINSHLQLSFTTFGGEAKLCAHLCLAVL